ncbi:NAD(P)H-hydrate dehydratase [Cohnella nanjingensis]|uniref:Bifunctional NAD(P)H-hydrate repair enzyme n=1 Tax=Cohnella nanjingensis TaxID=1387779 RepID=A0A7X0RZ26_9BACL|nr:NAD(P)H-hydrate dehydratase [Cohnella nanjingensis]MBB6674704.1 NAD(P)H-hydrate dehydratase [Cohnella nanjingensis]
MRIVTSEEMRNIDKAAIERIGIPALVLMENAGRAVAEEAMRLTAQAHGGPAKRWLVLAGKGNNGADGLVAARHLLEAGCEVGIAYAADPAGFRGEAAVQRDIAANLGLPAVVYAGSEGDPIYWTRYDGIVDALLGTGSRGAPAGVYAALIREANASGLPIVAIDTPSGLDADTGNLHDPCIRAARTVALAYAKRGLVQYPGAGAAGEVVVRAIGIPARLAEQIGVRTFALDERTLRERLGVDPARAREADTHKGTYGHALIAAGSRPMSGAGLLSARAALRGGCGLVTWAVPDRLVEPLAGRVPEAMIYGLPDEERGDWSGVAPAALSQLTVGKDALVLGPGLGRWAGDGDWLRELLAGLDPALPIVLDADSLNILADMPEASAQLCGRRAVLTPHPGEMARLAGFAVPDIQRDRIEAARRYATQHAVTLVLKGARTVVATPEGDVYVNATGNPGMATGGAGDVLAGLVGSLLAQGRTPDQAAAFGVWLHGAAGDRAAAGRPTSSSLVAGDIIEAL